jgi:excinuclease ABC subunit A
MESARSSENWQLLQQYLEDLLQRGYTRFKILDPEGGQSALLGIQSLLEGGSLPKTSKSHRGAWHLVLDRLLPGDPDGTSRLSEAIEQAWVEGDGQALLVMGNSMKAYSQRFELNGKAFELPSLQLFNFSGPYGACPRCEGFGSILGIDPDLVIPDKRRSIYDGAIAPWKGEKMGEWNEALIHAAAKFRFPIHKPYQELSDEFRELLWKGNKYFDGLDAFFRMLEENTYKIQYRVMLSRYRGKTTCPDCQGTRLRLDASWVHLLGEDGKKWNLHQWMTQPAGDLWAFLKDFKVRTEDAEAARRPLEEIVRRLGYLCDLGLEYLTMHRLSNTLSGGESQRIKLATTLGSSLVGSLYILDEPSIGLHQRDSLRLVQLLYKLRDLGNTVVVVEHEPDLILAADHVVDIGPGAGHLGGNLVFEGPVSALLQDRQSMTAAYLSGRMGMPTAVQSKATRKKILLEGASLHNLKHVNVSFPLGGLCCVSGVSGSGKSSLIKGVLWPALANALGQQPTKAGPHDRLHGDLQALSFAEMVDQHPIGKSSRSNPATYSKAYDPIRNLFALQGLSKQRGYKASHFSFNVEGGGRCETCHGEGLVTVSMQFLADLHLPCEDCKGLRFQEDLLEVRYRGKHIADVLAMTIAEAISFFADQKEIVHKLLPLAEVGMGYVQLGQSSTTLSGGEAQRIKLASYLSRGHKDGAGFFLFDEPTTGLHLHDIAQLLRAFRALIAAGHSVVVVEHNPEVLMASDWIIDLGPEGGAAGGQIVWEGTPAAMRESGKGHTADALRSRSLAL